MASKRQHRDGWIIRWREPDPTNPLARVQRSWLCRGTEDEAEVHRLNAKAAERRGEPWTPADRRPGHGRPAVTPEADLVMEHGLRGLASLYLKERRTLGERRQGTLTEVRGTIRRFMRWACREFQQPHGSRLEPSVVLHVRVFKAWWTWMLSDDRVERVMVKRGNRTYERVYEGPLARSSAYKEWTTMVKFWRYSAQMEEVAGQVPDCPTMRLQRKYRDPSKKRTARRRSVAATWPQAARCVAEVPAWVRPVAVLCYYTGLRIGQAQAVAWEDVFLGGRVADDNGGPVIWVGDGKTKLDREGRFLPVHPDLARWLRARRAQPASIDDLPSDLRRTRTRAYKARVRGLEEGRVAWEAGDQPLASQLKLAAPIRSGRIRGHFGC